MAIDTYKVYVYVCDYPTCIREITVEDRGGATGRQPNGVFTGTVTSYDEKGLHRTNWVACSFEHIIGATVRMVKASLGN